MRRTETTERWLTALRSGRYRQARCRLATGTGYCCLGVLCEITGAFGASPADPLFSSPAWGTPSQTVCDLIDGSHEQIRYLAKLNDDGYSFRGIADVIERMCDATG